MSGFRLVDVWLADRPRDTIRNATADRDRPGRNLLRALVRHLDPVRVVDAGTDQLEAFLDRRFRNEQDRRNAVHELDEFYAWCVRCGHCEINPVAPLRGDADVDDLPAVLAAFASHQRRAGARDNTVMQRMRFLRRLAEYMAPRSLVDLTPDTLEAYLGTLDIGARARCCYLSHASGFFRWAISQGITNSNPALKLPRPRPPRGVPRPISDADLSKALELAPDPRTRSWLCLAAFAGLRCQEIAGIRRDDIIERGGRTLLVVAHAKGGRERVVPLHPEALSALHGWGLPSTGYVFPRTGRRDQPVPATCVSQEGGRFLHSIGIAESMHSLRHWFGTNVYADTLDLRLVQELLGHADPGTAALYAASDPAGAGEIVGRLNPRPRRDEDQADGDEG